MSCKNDREISYASEVLTRDLALYAGIRYGIDLYSSGFGMITPDSLGEGLKRFAEGERPEYAITWREDLYLVLSGFLVPDQGEVLGVVDRIKTLLSRYCDDTEVLRVIGKESE